MTLEELQAEHIKLQEQLQKTTEELETFKTNYNNSLEEKKSLSEEVQKLRNTNYELFERVNSMYVKNENTPPTNVGQGEETDEVVTIDDIVKGFI